MTLIDLGEGYQFSDELTVPVARRRFAARDRRAIGFALILALVLGIAPGPPVHDPYRLAARVTGALYAVPVVLGDVAYTVQRPKPGVNLVRVSAYALPRGTRRWASELDGVERVSGIREVGDVVVVDAVLELVPGTIVLDASSGREIWRTSEPSTLVGSVLVRYQSYAESRVGEQFDFHAQVTGTDVRTGQQIWQADVPTASGAQQVVAVTGRDLVVLVDQADASADTLDVLTGRVVASARLSQTATHVYYAAETAGRVVLVAEEARPVLIAADPASLAVAWTHAGALNARVCGAVICAGDAGGEALDPASGRVAFRRSVTWVYLVGVPGGLLALSAAPPGGIQQGPQSVAFLDETGYGAKPLTGWVYVGRSGDGSALLLRIQRGAAQSWLARLDRDGGVHVIGTIPVVRGCSGAAAGLVCAVDGSSFAILGAA